MRKLEHRPYFVLSRPSFVLSRSSRVRKRQWALEFPRAEPLGFMSRGFSGRKLFFQAHFRFFCPCGCEVTYLVDELGQKF